ncbi:MAG: Uma2 family endonuclease [Bacteroidetes bacterium]|nr:MAG: Uma2 family endonuclease [Bacteroidota bacterium]
MITSLDQLDPDKRYTYADYLTWKFKERVELWQGRMMKMSPAPNLRHQRIARDLGLALGDFLRNKPCELFIAPFDVRLPLPVDKQKKGKVDTVVQPDLCVVCDPDKLDEQGCNGAPDLVIEILSPGNSKREMRDKYALYEAAGVREYWIVDPVREWILTYVANEVGQFQSKPPYYAGDEVPSAVLEGFTLRADHILNNLED